jgi:hypothetical protein
MKHSGSIFLIFLTLSCKIFSQTSGSRSVAISLPVVTLMDIEPSGAISLNYTAPSEAGNAVTAPASNSSNGSIIHLQLLLLD